MIATTDHTDRLLEAVEALTKVRNVVQWQEPHMHEWQPCSGTHDPYGVVRCADADCALEVCGRCDATRTRGDQTPEAVGMGVHRETHPPLLLMLMQGISSQGGSPSPDPGIPIDADALELWAMVRDLVKLWCRQLDATFTGDNLLGSINNWHLAHRNAHRSKRISDVIDHDVTRMVEGWVRMIESKFDPPTKAQFEWPCPAMVPTRDADGTEIGYRRCGARRLVVDGEERFAIALNWTTLHAECARCKTAWDGERGFMNLRYESNLYEAEKEQANTERMAELERLAAGDTPKAQTADIA